MNPLWEIPKMNQSSKYTIICGLILNNQQLTKLKNAQGIYLSIYQAFNANINFSSTVQFFCRITWWQMVNCIRATFFNYQDIIKDCFLLSKMILSVSGGTILTDSTFAALVSIFGISWDENFITFLP